MTTAEPSAKRTKMDEASAIRSIPAEDCITFHLLKRGPGGAVVMDDDAHFPPEMTHQLFGQDETIRGYLGLDIDIWLTPRFQPFVDVKFDEHSKGTPAFKDIADNFVFDVAVPFKKTFSSCLFTEKPSFDEALAAEPGLVLEELGDQVASQKLPLESGGSELLIFRSQLSTASAELRRLHTCLQPLLVFFIDAASEISQDDPNWELFLCVEKSVDGELEVVGFTTCYKFYVFPDKNRVRLSQILVLPPHQGKGAGSLLLESVYSFADGLNAVDLTFEDPTETLQKMRDRKDLHRLLGCPWAIEAATSALRAAASDKGKGKADDKESSPTSPFNLNPELRAKMQTELKLSKSQAQRVWETMLYSIADSTNQTEAVSAWIEDSLKESIASAQNGAVNKAVKDTEDGWVMYRGAVPGTGKPVVPLAPVEEASAEQKGESIKQFRKQRMADIKAVLGFESDEDEDEDEEEDNE
jgi:histone acetyltransferase 1